MILIQCHFQISTSCYGLSTSLQPLIVIVFNDDASSFLRLLRGLSRRSFIFLLFGNLQHKSLASRKQAPLRTVVLARLSSMLPPIVANDAQTGFLRQATLSTQPFTCTHMLTSIGLAMELGLTTVTTVLMAARTAQNGSEPLPLDPRCSQARHPDH